MAKMTVAFLTAMIICSSGCTSRGRAGRSVLEKDASGWIDACGFSGHGIMHAPATGLTVSELVADGEAKTVDVVPFRHGRFDEELPVETNIF